MLPPNPSSNRGVSLPARAVAVARTIVVRMGFVRMGVVRIAAIRIAAIAIAIRTVAIGVVMATAGVVVMAGCTIPSSPSVVPVPGGQGTGMVATVDRVIDGDTVDLSFRGRPDERARLLGIDTPETVKPDAPVECFGPEASARAHELLVPGTQVIVQRDEEARDRYGRLLVYLWRRNDGLFVNESLLFDGYASVLSMKPNTTRRAQLAAAERAARSSGSGLWGACDPPGGR